MAIYTIQGVDFHLTQDVETQVILMEYDEGRGTVLMGTTPININSIDMLPAFRQNVMDWANVLLNDYFEGTLPVPELEQAINNMLNTFIVVNGQLS